MGKGSKKKREEKVSASPAVINHPGEEKERGASEKAPGVN